MSMPLPGNGATPTTSTVGKVSEGAAAAPPVTSVVAPAEALGAVVGAGLAAPPGAVWAWAGSPVNSARAATTAAFPAMRRTIPPLFRSIAYRHHEHNPRHRRSASRSQ